MKTFIAFFLLFPLPLFSATFQRTQILMGDVPVGITVKTDRKEKAYRAMGKAFDEVRRLDAAVSEWRDSSDVTRLNRHAGLWVPIGPDLMAILVKAREISERTDGAFDVTFASRAKGVTYRDVQLLPELGLARLAKKKTRIGVSSIAKGYIVDRMAFILRKSGFRNFLINAGDIYAAGAWKVFLKGSDRSFTLHNEAISTSGLYERGDHIVDPRTRRTPRFYESATVIAPTSMMASPLATALFVTPPDKTEIFSNRIHGIRHFLK